MPRELTCQEIVELVTEHLDGALDDARREQLSTHLERCPDCAEYVRQFEQTIEAVGHLRSTGGAVADCDALVRAFRELGLDD
jgi:anti-sigma factor RsiW